jgi:hypothetical protein
MIAGAVAGMLLLAMAAAGCASAARTGPGAPSAAATASGAVSASLRHVHDPGRVTGTLAGPCTYRAAGGGELPDPHCTPGAEDPAVTAAVLCAPGYSTRSYRPPESQTSEFKYGEAYPAYGLPRTARTELDHLVSLELGGSNDASNLWPEAPPTPNPKDRVENALHAWVCAVTGKAAQARLGKAQRAIAENWTTAEQAAGMIASPSASPSSSGRPESTTPAPVRTTSRPPAPSSSSAPPVPAACHPVTSAGNCYEPGEFCRSSDRGVSGVAGDGKPITCESNDGRWRWATAA